VVGLADILAEEAASVLVVYDDHGGYGHPDHIQVHRVGVRAGELAGTPNVYEATIDRDRVVRMIRENPVPAGDDGPELPDITEDSDFGVRAAEVTTRLDVGDQVRAKRAAMRCHRSQIPDDTFWLMMPDEQFALAFSEEDYIHRGVPEGTAETSFELG
jgi:LmbE family N-acetylglucosaminyl deacetylase